MTEAASHGLGARLGEHLLRLCGTFPDRHLGGEGNRSATELFAAVAEASGFSVERAELDCIEWERGESALDADDLLVPLHTGPYSLPCRATTRLAVASSLEELESEDFSGTVLLLHGDLVGEQLMAKNFVFYNPERHRRIVAAIEASAPTAVIAATGRNPDLAGGSYPFPLIEDGDFDIPNACMRDVDAGPLLERAGEEVTVGIASDRKPSKATQLVARKPGRGRGRIVFFAHIDSKDGTPGALDNATGVAALLGLAETLADHEGSLTVELVPLNGEDYYAATGQMHYLAENRGRLGDVVLGVNVDGAGFVGHGTAISLYGCPDPIETAVRRCFRHHGFVEGPQWPQGDHSLLVMNGVPAIAVTSEDAFFVASTLAHTEKDTLDLVDCETVAEVSRFFRSVVLAVDGLPASSQGTPVHSDCERRHNSPEERAKDGSG